MDADVIGFMAAIVTTISIIPQVVKVVREKSAKSISWWFIFFVFVGCGLWLVYGVMEKSVCIVANNIFMIASWVIIVWYKYRYD